MVSGLSWQSTKASKGEVEERGGEGGESATHPHTHTHTRKQQEKREKKLALLTPPA